MNFLDKLDFMMEKLGINKSKLSNLSGVPYTTIDTFYKKGYENTKLSTIKKLAESLDVSMDYLIVDSITDEDYGKTSGFSISSEERQHIKKYRALDEHGKRVVNILMDEETGRMRSALTQRPAEEAEIIQFSVPSYEDPMSAGTGQPAGYGYGSNLLLIKEPPPGTSYVAPIAGDSMEPTYHDGDRLFIQACYEINVGEVGVFFMDSQQWVKELGEGVLLSHNPKYEPRPMTEDIRCQGRVLGVCDKSFLEE